MRDAQADKQTAEHNVIDDAMRDRGEGYTVFSIVSHSFIYFSYYFSDILSLACWYFVSPVREQVEECKDEGLYG